MEKTKIVEDITKVLNQLYDDIFKLEEAMAKERAIANNLHSLKQHKEGEYHYWSKVSPIEKKIYQVQTTIDSLKNAIKWTKRIDE